MDNTILFEATLNFIPPPKSNRYMQGKNGIRFLPARIKEAIDDAIFILSQFKPSEPINRPCQLEIVYYFKDRRKRDLDNLNKTLQDCLEKAYIIKDDSLFFRIVIEKRFHTEERVDIRIKQLEESYGIQV